MTPEELQKALEGVLAAQLAPLSERIGKLEASTAKVLEAAAIIDRVKEHAGALKATADAMEADGIGLHPENGHVVALRKLAGNMEASAATGQVPHSIEGYVYTAAAKPAPASAASASAAAADGSASATDPALADKIAGLETKIQDLSAAAFKNAAEPERKTLPPAIMSLVAKAGISMPGEGEKLNVRDVDAALDKAGLDRTKRLAVKQGLMMQGVL